LCQDIDTACSVFHVVEQFLAHLDRTIKQLDAYLTNSSTWFHRTYGNPGEMLVAYFSAEFGLTE
jgi:starch phosphorylase